MTPATKLVPTTREASSLLNSQSKGQNEQQPNSNEQKEQNQQETPLERDEKIHNHDKVL